MRVWGLPHGTRSPGRCATTNIDSAAGTRGKLFQIGGGMNHRSYQWKSGGGPVSTHQKPPGTVHRVERRQDAGTPSERLIDFEDARAIASAKEWYERSVYTGADARFFVWVEPDDVRQPDKLERKR